MAYRSSTIQQGASGTLVISVPSGSTTGDVMIACLGGDVVQNISAPAGWAALGSEVDLASPDGMTARCYYRNASGSEPGNYTFTVTDNAIGFIVTFSGRDTTSAPTVQSSTNGSANASPAAMAATGVTASAGDDLAAFYFLDTTAIPSVWNISQPTSFTDRQEANRDWITASATTQDAVSAGATGSISATATQTSGSASTGWIAFVVRVPVSGGGGGAADAYLTMPPLSPPRR